MIGKISDKAVTFLIDTGANVTAIRADVWRRIPAIAKLSPSPTAINTIKAVRGAEIPVLGQLEIPFEIDTHTYNFRALVIECLTYEALLGRDFLECYNAKIDLGQRYPVVSIQSRFDTSPFDTHLSHFDLLQTVDSIQPQSFRYNLFSKKLY